MVRPAATEARLTPTTADGRTSRAKLHPRRKRAKHHLGGPAVLHSVLGDYKSVVKGVGELRFDYGSGYRVSAYRDGPLVLLLLAGSSKADRKAVIAQAAAYSKDWKERNA